MKITAKTTKQEMKDFLKENFKFLKDKNLAERVSYALKVKEDKITRTDLIDLSKEVDKLLEEKKAPTKSEPKAENSVKKPLKKSEAPAKSEKSEKTAKKSDEKVDTKKSPKKSPKKDGVTALENNDKTVQMAKMFPEEMYVEDNDTTYRLASDIKTMDDLSRAVIDNDEDIIFAFYWTKRHLKQFNYFNKKLGQPASFKNDLDLTAVVHLDPVSKKICYAVSLYTEAIYSILPENLEEDKGLRFADGIEYQIYRAV